MKKRIGMIRHIRKLHGVFNTNYNVKSIPYFDSLSKRFGWNLRHAENGGEAQLFGYFVDAYDESNNVIVEYDEPRHYTDVDCNVLCEKDIERQNYIIERLHCRFYRYNEKTRTLWRVS